MSRNEPTRTFEPNFRVCSFPLFSCTFDAEKLVLPSYIFPPHILGSCPQNAFVIFQQTFGRQVVKPSSPLRFGRSLLSSHLGCFPRAEHRMRQPSARIPQVPNVLQLLFVALLTQFCAAAMPNASYQLRRYETSDKPAVIKLFCGKW